MKWLFFFHNKWVAKRQGHRNLEFHIVHLLEPAPQTQTATAHLQTTWTVYFDGQGTQKLPCGKISPPPPPRGGGGGLQARSWSMSVSAWLFVSVSQLVCLWLPVCLTAAHMSACASAVSLAVCLSACLPACLPVSACLSLCPPAGRSVCIYLSVCLFEYR